ncbi:hypothetical protein DKX38_012250 [Salix brachista]|uniref:Uncharacterized protein n=1 Tax=Salix brachista TaxID=2182728 RepID=A0A5N5LNE9_9ROSI|nr:hypothetical protein DKX38_012250 [Salix brachista]
MSHQLKNYPSEVQDFLRRESGSVAESVRTTVREGRRSGEGERGAEGEAEKIWVCKGADGFAREQMGLRSYRNEILRIRGWLSVE